MLEEFTHEVLYNGYSANDYFRIMDTLTAEKIPYKNRSRSRTAGQPAGRSYPNSLKTDITYTIYVKKKYLEKARYILRGK